MQNIDGCGGGECKIKKVKYANLHIFAMWNIILLLFVSIVAYLYWFKSTCTFTAELFLHAHAGIDNSQLCKILKTDLEAEEQRKYTAQLTSLQKAPQTRTAGKGQTDINFSLRMNCNNFCTADFLIQLHQQAKLCLSYSVAFAGWYDKEFWKLKLWWNLKENYFTASCYIVKSTELQP